MHNTKLVSTQLAAHLRLSSDLCLESDDEIKYICRGSYSSVVDSLMYAMICSHPNLSHALCVVSRFMANPSKKD
jgi:ATP-binding cassette subfamily B (MDR/TAP) protein 1